MHVGPFAASTKQNPKGSQPHATGSSHTGTLGPLATRSSHISSVAISALIFSPSAPFRMAWPTQNREELPQQPISSATISSWHMTKLNRFNKVLGGSPLLVTTLAAFLRLRYSTGSGMSSFFVKIPPLTLTKENESAALNSIRTHNGLSFDWTRTVPTFSPLKTRSLVTSSTFSRNKPLFTVASSHVGAFLIFADTARINSAIKHQTTAFISSKSQERNSSYRPKN
mmetsp:Transcript_2816/g.4064  ORF Transcript_2816/g.4064 Transcript_2816/m.4064 type:complete len:226 (+) Transcript_2816:173-850(+)